MTIYYKYLNSSWYLIQWACGNSFECYLNNRMFSLVIHVGTKVASTAEKIHNLRYDYIHVWVEHVEE